VVYSIIASLAAVSYWVAIDIFFRACFAFKRQNGTYFWSIAYTTVGIVMYNTATLLRNFTVKPQKTMLQLLLNLGWGSISAGFSFVLWSRLHLVINNTKFLKVTLVIIIANAIIWNALAIGIALGLVPKYKFSYPLAAEVITTMETVIYIVQEVFLTCLYMYRTARFLKSGFSTHTRKIISLLLLIQILVIVCDTTLFVLSFFKVFIISATLFPLTSSIKLHLEIAVLNQLRKLVQHGSPSELVLPVQEVGTRGPIASKNKTSIPSVQPEFLTMPRNLTISLPNSNTHNHLISSVEGRINEKNDSARDAEEIVEIRECNSRSAVARYDSAGEDIESLESLEAQYLGRARF
jgi:hypothetical protein